MRATRLALAPGDRDRLQRWVDDPSTGAVTMTRMRIVLLAAEGWLNVEIAAALEVSVNTVTTWRARYAADGLDGLFDRPRSGRPRSIDRSRVIAATLRPPDAGRDRWSCRELGARLGVGEATVARVWREYGLAPRPGRAFEFAVQPALTAHTVEIVGLCITQETRAVALLVDRSESSGDRRVDPVEPSTVAESLRPSCLARFVEQALQTSPGQRVHIVADQATDVRRLMIGAPISAEDSTRLHFTLSGEIWLNLLEVWSALDGSVRDDHPVARARATHAPGTSTIWVRKDPDLFEQSAG